MPTIISDKVKYINEVFIYILYVSSCLINEQKVIMNIIGTKSFFDVIVPKEILLSMFKIKLVKILSNILESVSKFGIEIISTFSF